MIWNLICMVAESPIAGRTSVGGQGISCATLCTLEGDEQFTATKVVYKLSIIGD